MNFNFLKYKQVCWMSRRSVVNGSRDLFKDLASNPSNHFSLRNMWWVKENSNGLPFFFPPWSGHPCRACSETISRPCLTHDNSIAPETAYDNGGCELDRPLEQDRLHMANNLKRGQYPKFSDTYKRADNMIPVTKAISDEPHGGYPRCFPQRGYFRSQ